MALKVRVHSLLRIHLLHIFTQHYLETGTLSEGNVHMCTYIGILTKVLAGGEGSTFI